MSNCQFFYDTVRRYRKTLTEINDKYDRQVESKAVYAGSAGHAADLQKIEQQRAAEIAALRADCAETFDICLKSMTLHADRRPMTPPSPAQLALLQALKMRDHLNRDELEHAAHSLSDCAVGLGVLEELATRHGILGFHAPGVALSDIFVRNAIQELRKNARTLLSLDRCGERGRQLLFREGPHGSAPTFESIGRFRLDVDVAGPADCASVFGGVPDGAYSAFAEIVG